MPFSYEIDRGIAELNINLDLGKFLEKCADVTNEL